MVNQLQQPPEMDDSQLGLSPQQMQGVQQPTPPQPAGNQMSPEQVHDIHERIGEYQKMLDGLIKMPDDQLDLRAVFSTAGDMISKYSASGGKRGISAADIVKEISSPDFPTPDENGNQPPADAIRQFLQHYFDQSVMNQAKITAHMGGSMQRNEE